MASDDAYADFLEKANQDPSEGHAKTQQNKGGVAAEFKATEAGVETPAVLVKATKDAFYTSDADEPFVPVALSWDGKLPNEEEFANLIQHWEPAQADVEILDPLDWDSQGQYRDVIDAVTEAGKGNDVRVYRISKARSRVEYWVVASVDGKLVGAKALAIES